ncbi:MAG: membrane protein insertion efficiency factor YidD [Actinomycetota bacterium]
MWPLSVADRVLVGVVHAYQRVVSPLLGSHCRFVPSCSAYAEQALREHGALRGCYLTVRRLLRCHPFHRGGFDLVPTSGKIRQGPVDV